MWLVAAESETRLTSRSICKYIQAYVRHDVYSGNWLYIIDYNPSKDDEDEFSELSDNLPYETQKLSAH